MDNINKTLYIPLYGKAITSKKGIILKDTKAEEIWDKAGFKLKRKSKSKWLGYFLAMRARVFDEWTKSEIEANKDAIVIQIGVGLDSRFLRLNQPDTIWYDIDLEDVIEERKKYYNESDKYFMKVGDATEPKWVENFENGKDAIVIIEGLAMYITNEQVNSLFLALSNKFKNIHILMDVYTSYGAKITKRKNSDNDNNEIDIYGLDDPKFPVQGNELNYVKELIMVPADLVDEIKGIERTLFSTTYSGKTARKMYRLFEYRKDD